MSAKQELKIVGKKEEVVVQKELPKPIKIEMSFDQWWLTKNLKPALKEAVKKHLESKGFLHSMEYDKGLKDFGI